MKNTSIKKYLTSAVFIIISLTFLSACNTQKEAVGREDVIYVVADSMEFYNLEADLLTVFGKVIYTPQAENLFNLKRIGVSKLNRYERKKNILIVAPLNSGSYTSKYINSILDSTVKNLVETDSEYVFNKHNFWAKNQLVMILTSSNMNKLKANILKGSENLLYQFQDISNKRLFSKLYNPRYERKKIEAKFLKDYGWIIYVQADFVPAMDKPEDNFVWLRRAPNSSMERWIFVHWIDNASPSFLKPDSIYKERNRITKKYYETSDNKAYVQIADSYLTSKEVNFEGKYAIMTQGLWRTNDHQMGGPFVNYTFYDAATKRIYMLDGSIFAPKYYKKQLIQQVDVTLHSFKTKEEMSKDKVEDLLDELD